MVLIWFVPPLPTPQQYKYQLLTNVIIPRSIAPLIFVCIKYIMHMFKFQYSELLNILGRGIKRDYLLIAFLCTYLFYQDLICPL